MSNDKWQMSRAHLALIAVQLIFGTWPILGKVVLRAMSSSALVGFRVVGAAAALLLLRRQSGEFRRMSKRDVAVLVLCSMLGVVLNQFLFVKGLSLTTVINATLLSTTIPAFTLLVSIVLGFDRVSLRRIIGILLAAAGVIYLVDPLRADFSAQTRTGNLLLVINSLLYGAYIAISKDIFRRYGALNVITWIFAIAAIVTLPVSAYSLSQTGLQSVSVEIWLALAYIIIVPTVIAYYLNAWALTRVLPSTVASYIYLQPLIAFGLAPFLLGERFNSRVIIAGILIFAGVGVVVKRRRSQASQEVTKRPDALAH
ncbi:MAG TPA: DMT family transporter [Pyrinomonadaceae bacterium]|nr:DMT family transporter [Pyrinomonadaceae bacterium]